MSDLVSLRLVFVYIYITGLSFFLFFYNKEGIAFMWTLGLLEDNMMSGVQFLFVKFAREPFRGLGGPHAGDRQSV